MSIASYRCAPAPPNPALTTVPPPTWTRVRDLPAAHPAPRCRLGLAAVHFVDTAGITPFTRSAQRRLAAGRAPVVVVSTSHALRRLVCVLPDDPGLRALMRHGQ